MNTTITEQIRNLPSENGHPGLSDASHYYEAGHEASCEAAATLVAPLEASHGELLAALKFIRATQKFKGCHMKGNKAVAVAKEVDDAIANAEKLNTKE